AGESDVLIASKRSAWNARAIDVDIRQVATAQIAVNSRRWMIQSVKELAPELHVQPLLDLDVLEYAQVQLIEAWPTLDIALRTTERRAEDLRRTRAVEDVLHLTRSNDHSSLTGVQCRQAVERGWSCCP